MENFKLISPQVLKDAAEILQTESNELARHLDAGDFKGLNYRVEIAVRTETQRLRGTTFKKFFKKLIDFTLFIPHDVSHAKLLPPS